MVQDIKKVFISSSFHEKFKLGFEEERKFLRDKILDSKVLIDISLDPIQSYADGTTEESLKRVRECDIFILFIGTRYGKPREDGISLTHLEYREALKHNKAILAYFFPYDTSFKDVSKIKNFIKEVEEDDKVRILGVEEYFNKDQLFSDVLKSKSGKTQQNPPKDRIKEFCSAFVNAVIIDTINAHSAIRPSYFKTQYKNQFDSVELLMQNQPRPIEDIYLNLSIIKEQKDTEKQTKTESVNIDTREPVDIKALTTKSKKSLIYGKAGIGKTTLLKYIANQWAKDKLFKEFDYVIYLPLRQWGNGGFNSAIRDYYFSKDDSIREIITKTNEKMLVLLDGYDELSNQKKEDIKNEIIKYSLTNYIITSRSYGYNKGEFNIDEYFEITGFAQENIYKYIDIFFEEQPNKITALKKNLQKNTTLNQIATIPIMLEMLCILWQDEKLNLGLTITELYTNIIEKMLKDYAENKKDSNVYEWENREDIKALLGKIAFEGLIRNIIGFNGYFIKDVIGKDNLVFFKENIMNSGFIKSESREKSLLDNNLEFIHLSFQEYFASTYVSSLSQREQKSIIENYKFYPHMQIFFSFLAGLINDKDFLIRSIKDNPKDIMGYYEFLLLIHCYVEAKQVNVVKFNNLLSYWIKIVIYNKNQNYRALFDKFKYISNLINKDTINLLLDIMKDKNVRSNISGNIAQYLSAIDDEYYIDGLLGIVEDKKVNYYTRARIAESFLIIDNRFSDKIFNMAIKFVKDTNVKNHVRVIVAKSFSKVANKDIGFVDDLLNVVKMNGIHFKVTGEIVRVLLNTKKHETIILNSLYDILRDGTKKTDKKMIVIDMLLSQNIDNYYLQDMLFKIVYSQNIEVQYKIKVAKSLSGIKHKDMRFFNLITEIIGEERISFRIRNEACDILSILVKNNKTYTSNLKKLIMGTENINILSRIENIYANTSREIEVSKKINYIKKAKFMSNENNNIFLSSITNTIEDEESGVYLQEVAWEELSKINRQDDYFVANLLNIVKNDNLSIDIRKKTLRKLSEIKRNSNTIFSQLVEIIENKKISFNFGNEIITIISNFEHLDNNIITALVNIIRNTSITISCRITISRFLLNSNYTNKEIIDVAIEILKNKKIKFNKEVDSFVNTILNTNRKDNYQISCLVEMIEDTSIVLSTRVKIEQILLIASFDNLEIFNMADLKSQKLSQNLTMKSSTKAIFKAYDKEYINLDLVVRNAIHFSLPIYVLDKKLCTVFKGEKLKTKKNCSKDEVTACIAQLLY